MVRKIWGDSDTGLIQSVGKGRIIRSNDPVTILKTLNIQPDTELPEKVYGIHRCVGDTDIYFLYNDSTRTIHFNGKFRVSEDKSPEYWMHRMAQQYRCCLAAKKRRYRGADYPTTV